MKKLNMAIQYECKTSFKYIWVFYAILYGIAAVTYVLAYIGTGSIKEPYVSALEMNSLIYLGIFGVLGFKEDFKMLIQNGFTRKYIFIATLSVFVFVSAIMAVVDTVMGRFLHTISSGYFSVFGGLYGYDKHVILNFLWLFFIDLLICCLAYLAILIHNKIGKRAFIFLAITFGLTVFLIIPTLVEFIIPKDITKKILDFIIRSSGFMSDGTINFAYPILILAGIIGIVGTCSYLIIRRTELKT